MKVHELKSRLREWDRINNGDKTAELRRNDRDFAVGDLLILRKAYEVVHVNGPSEWVPSERPDETLFAIVTDIIGKDHRSCADSQDALNDDFVLLSFKLVQMK